MNYETEEQQVEHLKQWWSDNGTPLVVGAILGLAGFGGWKYWNAEQIKYQSAASDSYKQVVTDLDKNEREAVVTDAEKVIAEYGDSAYAVLAALAEAKEFVAKSDLESAKAKLQWVIDNHSRNELANLAKLRLARIVAKQGDLDAALKLLAFDKESAYFASANWIKGNLLLSAGRNDEALTALKIAAEDEKLNGGDPTLQLKIEQLEGAKVASVETNSTAIENGVEMTPVDEKDEASETTDSEKKGAE